MRVNLRRVIQLAKRPFLCLFSPVKTGSGPGTLADGFPRVEESKSIQALVCSARNAGLGDLADLLAELKSCLEPEFHGESHSAVTV